MSHLQSNVTSNIWTTDRISLILLVGQMFFLAFAFSLLNIVTYTLFLIDYGANMLPYVYITIAILVSLVSYGYVELQKCWQLSTLTLTTFTTFAALFFLGWLGLILSNARWLSFVLMVSITLVELKAMILIGRQAGRLLTVRQMKQFYPYVITSMIVGYMIGGFLVSPLLFLCKTTENLLFVSGLSTLIAVGVSQVTIVKFRRVLNQADTEDHSAASKKISLRKLFTKRYIRMLFLYQMFSAVGTQLVRYIYFTQAEIKYPVAEDLAQFFGTLTVVREVSSLLFASLVAGRLLNHFGLRFGLAANPSGVGFVAIGMAVSGSVVGIDVSIFFWLAVGAYLIDVILTDGTTTTSIKTSYQVLPSEERAAVETMVEGIGVPIAIGMTGIGLLILTVLPTISLLHVTLLIVIIAAVWTAMGVLTYRDYPNMLRQALTTRRFQSATLEIVDESSLTILKEGLSSDHLGVVIYALDMVEGIDRTLLSPLLLELLEHAEPEVRCEVLRRIERLGMTDLLPVIRKKFFNEDVPSVQGAILRTLAALGGSETFDEIGTYVQASDPDIRRGAMVGLLRSGGIYGILLAGVDFLNQVNSDDVTDRLFAARILGDVGISEFYQPLIRLLNDHDLDVRKAALFSSGKLKNPQLWPLVVDALYVSETRSAAISALVAGKESVLPELQAALVVAQNNYPVLIALVQICGRIGGKHAITLLKDNIDYAEDHVRAQIFRSLHLCAYQAQGEDLTRVRGQLKREIMNAANMLGILIDIGDNKAISLLRNALYDQLGRTRERCVYLLSFLYDAQTVLQAQNNLRYGSDEKRAYALEALDVLFSQEIKNMVLPLFEHTVPERQLSALQPLFPQERKSLEQQLQNIIMVSGEDFTPWMRGCALYALSSLDLPAEQIVNLVHQAFAAPEPFIKETALWTLIHLQAPLDQTYRAQLRQESHPAIVRLLGLLETHGTQEDGLTGTVMATIEKVLFLKNVALFHQTLDEDLFLIAEVAQQIHFSPEEHLLIQGEFSDCLYVIVNGTIDVLVNEVGKVAVRKRGDVIGEMAVLVDSPRTATCVAATDVAALKVDREPFLKLLSEKSDLSLGIIRILVHRIEELNRKQADE